MIDRQVAETLYAQGRTLREIGELYGVSRQRINQILRRQGVPRQRKVRKGKYIGDLEARVSKMLTKNGVANVLTPHTSNYNILTENGIKVSVKQRLNPEPHSYKGLDNRYRVYKFYFNDKSFDYVVLFIGNPKRKRIYIFSKDEIGTYLTIPEVPLYRNDRLSGAKDAWNKIN